MFRRGRNLRADPRVVLSFEAPGQTYGLDYYLVLHGHARVTEGGGAQTIETFKLVKLDGGVAQAAEGPVRRIRTDADEELEASRDDVRLFAIFLDDYHVRRLNGPSVGDQLAAIDGIDAIQRVRSERIRFRGTPVVVTYHPAALLRNPNWKKPTWDDIRIARQLLDR